jgi:hypothetical protein
MINKERAREILESHQMNTCMSSTNHCPHANKPECMDWLRVEIDQIIDKLYPEQPVDGELREIEQYIGSLEFNEKYPKLDIYEMCRFLRFKLQPYIKQLISDAEDKAYEVTENNYVDRIISMKVQEERERITNEIEMYQMVLPGNNYLSISWTDWQSIKDGK